MPGGARGWARTRHARELLTPERRQVIVSHKLAILAALDLERRIRAMASRWHYAPDEVVDALEAARANPAGWLSAVTQDAERAALFERAGMAYPT